MFSNKFIKKNDLIHKNEPIKVFKRTNSEFMQAGITTKIRKKLYKN